MTSAGTGRGAAFGAVTLFVLAPIVGCQAAREELIVNSPPPTLASISDLQRARLPGTRFLFGHQSVGRNILTGINELDLDGTTLGIATLSFDRASPDADGIVHFVVGVNGDPASKGRAFEQALDARRPDGWWAGYELCYLDFTRETDVDAVFREYQRSVDAVRVRHPDVRLIHFTAPLTVEEPRTKGVLKGILGRTTTRALNAQRAAFNARMRATYSGTEPLFDLARSESTLEDGTRRVTLVDGHEIESLPPEFAADEGHLNVRGRRIVASRFLAFLANLP